MAVSVIRQFDDVDFLEWPKEGSDCIDEEDNIKIQFIPNHGTVLYVTGVFDDDDLLMCVGAKTGSSDFRTAIYPGFLEFEVGWYRLIGRDDLADEVEETMRRSSEVVMEG